MIRKLGKSLRNGMKSNEKAGFYQKLFTLVFPIAFQNLMTAAVSACDALMLGVISQDALSAVSLAGQIQFIQNLFLASLTIGTTVLAAQYWGKGDRDSVEKILAFVLKLSAVVSLLFFLGASFFPGHLMRIFTPEAVLIEKGTHYLRVVGASYLLTGISQIYLCIMKNSGKVFKSTIIGSSAMILNILLNAVLIYGLFFMPAMGIAGAALATVISRGIELIWTVLESWRKDSVRLRQKYLLHRDRLLEADFFRYTLPVLGNELVWGGGFTIYSVIMGHLGNDAVAANSIANIVKNLIACLCLGIAGGGAILVGNELGKGLLERAKKYGDWLCHLSIIAGTCSGLLLLAFTPVILNVTNLSPTAHGYLRGMLFICAYYLIGKSVNSAVIAGIFCAGGDSKFGFICDTVTMWIVTVPIGAAAAFYFKLPVLAVYVILSLDEIVKLPAVYVHYKKYCWVKNLTREEEIL